MHRPASALRRRPACLAALAVAGWLAWAAPARSAPTETVAPLLRQAIPNLPGTALTAVTVIFPPGARARPHRHGAAFLYAYVLEGAVRSRIEGQPARVYRTGDSWTEQPGDHHLLTENLSGTETARLLVVFVAHAGDALKTDDPAAEPSP